MSVRLNKLLAERGIGARRKCDELIRSGVVHVNGKVVTEPGTAIEPGRDKVEVQGRRLPPPQRSAYYVLHKPVGVISTLSDPEGRPTVRELLPPGARLFPVGRLDADTSGVLLLTNDGELAHHLMHPRYGVSKSYRVHADRVPGPAMLKRLEEGIEFEPGVVSAPARIRVLDHTPGDSVLEISIHEGRYRQVRRMCEAAGLQVHRLHRWAYGPLKLKDLPRGMWRELSDAEVAALRAASARPRRDARVPHRPRGLRRGRDAGPPEDRRERAPRRYRGDAPPSRPAGDRVFERPMARPPRFGDRPKRERFERPAARPPRFGDRPRRDSFERPAARPPRFGDRPRRDSFERPAARPPRFGDRPRRDSFERPAGREGRAPRERGSARPFAPRGPRERREGNQPFPPRGRRAGPRPRRSDAPAAGAGDARARRPFRGGPSQPFRGRPAKGRFGRPAGDRGPRPAAGPGGWVARERGRPFRDRPPRGERTRRPGSGGTAGGRPRGPKARRKRPDEA